MATTPPTKAQRDKNLDDLERLVKDWGKKEQDRLENEVKFMRSVLKGRGSNGVGTKNLAAASVLLQNSIKYFVTFA